MDILDHIADYIVNYEEKDNRTKVLNVLIAVVGFVLSAILETIYLKYLDKTYGDSHSGLWEVYSFLQLFALYVIFGLSISNIKELKGTGCIGPILVLMISGAFVIAKTSIVKSQIKDFEKQALSNSYYTTGIITNKDYSTSKHGTTYYLWAGQNDSLAKRHTVREKMYKLATVGDTIILKVSKEYPRINEVINWTPTNDDIAKYLNENN